MVFAERNLSGAEVATRVRAGFFSSKQSGESHFQRNQNRSALEQILDVRNGSSEAHIPLLSAVSGEDRETKGTRGHQPDSHPSETHGPALPPQPASSPQKIGGHDGSHEDNAVFAINGTDEPFSMPSTKLNLTKVFIITGSAAGGAILILVFTFAFYSSSRSRRRANEELKASIEGADCFIPPTHDTFDEMTRRESVPWGHPLESLSSFAKSESSSRSRGVFER